MGTMSKNELGSTGIKVSKMGFGAHIRPEFLPYNKEREWMLREAFDLGLNTYDVYDRWNKCFQYEPMGRYLEPIKHDVVISINADPYDGRTLEEEIERDLRLFKRDYIDMVRFHANEWEEREQLFRYKEQGKIRAVGMSTHNIAELDPIIDQYPMDYVIIPFNFYHNFAIYSQFDAIKEGNKQHDAVVEKIRQRGIGLVTMKPVLGDWLATPMRWLAEDLDETGRISFGKASLRYVLNSGLNPDVTLVGMMNPWHVHDNFDAFYNPTMSTGERQLLKSVREKARIVAKHYLPDHYKFLEKWVPDSWDDSDLFGTV